MSLVKFCIQCSGLSQGLEGSYTAVEKTKVLVKKEMFNDCKINSNKC